MSDLMAVVTANAVALGVPLTVHVDLTYRCNERCEHCYLDHDDHGELTFDEIRSLLDQLADAGTLFLTLSGGEALLRRDFFDILAYARSLQFCVRVKTNGVLVRASQADRLRALGVHEVQVSLYSHRADVHDRITKLPGSFARSVEGIVAMKARGLRVVVANVLMQGNFQDYGGVRALAESLGVECTLDPTVTPRMDGDRSLLALGASADQLHHVFHDPDLVGPVDAMCAVPSQDDAEDVSEALPCSAGHSACYVSPYGDVFPCVQFPLPTGNIRRQRFLEIWRHSPAFEEVRSIRVGHLPTCSQCSHVGSCTRCPGLAYMEGSMRGPSELDCAKSFARTGVPSAGMLAAARNDAGYTPPAGVQFIPLDRVGRSSGIHPEA
jgi:AdoMet-dependent heme synthase